MQDSDALRKIRALLDKAAATEFPAEADSLRARATALMANYSVSETMLDAARGVTVDDPMELLEVALRNPYRVQQAHLLQVIARALNCSKVTLTRTRASTAGRRSDLQRVEFLYTLLVVQMLNGAAKVTYPDDWYRLDRTAAQLAKLRRGFLAGFSSAIRARLEEGREEAVAQYAGTGAELALADRTAAANAHIDHVQPTTGKARTVPSGARDGQIAGLRAGHAADLGRNRVSGRARRTLGA